MAKEKKILGPTYTTLIKPVFEALVQLGKSGSNDEIRDVVIKIMDLSDEIVDEPHKGISNQRTELEYQLAWARTYLKKFGAITNSERGIWIIKPEFYNATTINDKEVTKFISIKKKNSGKETPEIGRAHV